MKKLATIGAAIVAVCSAIWLLFNFVIAGVVTDIDDKKKLCAEIAATVSDIASEKTLSDKVKDGLAGASSKQVRLNLTDDGELNKSISSFSYKVNTGTHKSKQELMDIARSVAQGCDAEFSNPIARIRYVWRSFCVPLNWC